MRYLKLAMVTLLLVMPMTMASQSRADDSRDSHYWYRNNDAPDVNIWTNKGFGSTYYFGEDVAVYFQTDQDAYVVVYDIDPSGDVRVLYPSTVDGSTFVRGGDVIRVPDANDDFKLEVADNSGQDRIYAVASYDYINSPDFMRYVGYDYGNTQDYDDNYFVMHTYGNLDNFIDDVDSRISSGSISVAYTNFNVDDNYRNNQYYRYADYRPYDVGSVWIGCDFPGSEIWIDGIFYGFAPVLVPRIWVGYHWVWVYYNGYPCYQQEFWVPRYHRFDLNIRVDNHFRDGRYRHDEFNRWRFIQRPIHNDPGFIKDARVQYDKSVRTRSLPSHVVRDYVDRGVMTRDNPLAKRVRTEPGIDRNPGRIITPGRTIDRSVIDNGNKNVTIYRGNKTSDERGNTSNPNKGDVRRNPNTNDRGREAPPSRGNRGRSSSNDNGNSRSKMIVVPDEQRPQAPEKPNREQAPAVRQTEQPKSIGRGDNQNDGQNTRDIQQEQKSQQQDGKSQQSKDNGNYRQRDNSNSDKGSSSEKSPRNEKSSRSNGGGRESRGRQR